MNYTAGIDIGVAYSKAVIMNNGESISGAMLPSGSNFNLTAKNVLDKALKTAHLSASDIYNIVATGHGAENVSFANKVISDLVCSARAISVIFPSVMTIIDIGALATKVIRLDQNGSIAKFTFSGRCAGGSAKVLQVIARVLNVKLNEIGDLSLKSRNRVEFNTGCAVFMETEAVSRVAEGASKEDLLSGVHYALASQIYSLAEKVGMEKDYVIIGGGAHNSGLVKAVTDVAGEKFIVPEKPQLISATGAALIAEENRE